MTGHMQVEAFKPIMQNKKKYRFLHCCDPFFFRPLLQFIEVYRHSFIQISVYVPPQL